MKSVLIFALILSSCTLYDSRPGPIDKETLSALCKRPGVVLVQLILEDEKGYSQPYCYHEDKLIEYEIQRVKREGI